MSQFPKLKKGRISLNVDHNHTLTEFYLNLYNIYIILLKDLEGFLKKGVQFKNGKKLNLFFFNPIWD